MSEGPVEELNEDPSPTIMLVIEWNGKKPSGNWYHRLHQYGLYSRGRGGGRGRDAGELSLLQWRALQPGERKTRESRGLILQEGVILCKSMSLAKDLAMWAKGEGAEIIQIGTYVVQDFSISEDDQKAFESMKAKATKKGRKRVIERGSYVITCLDEIETFQKNLDSAPFNCPKCGSSRIFTRMGKRAVYLVYYQINIDGTAPDSVTDYWVRTRFNTGRFEIPVLKKAGKNAYPVPWVTVENAHTDYGLPLSKDLPADFVLAQERDESFKMHILDVAYCVSSKGLPQRMDERYGVLASYAQAGGEKFQTFVSSEESLDMVDLVSGDPSLMAYMIGDNDG